MPPGWIGSIAHPLIVAVMAPLTLLYVALRRHRRWRPQRDALLLLALLMLLRCVLDPWDSAYYPLPFLFALVAWEGLSHEAPAGARARRLVGGMVRVPVRPALWAWHSRLICNR